MKTVKYTKDDKFQCLEDLREPSSELTLTHMGRENCLPYHVFSGVRDEYILHFVTSGHGISPKAYRNYEDKIELRRQREEGGEAE